MGKQGTAGTTPGDGSRAVWDPTGRSGGALGTHSGLGHQEDDSGDPARSGTSSGLGEKAQQGQRGLGLL